MPNTMIYKVAFIDNDYYIQTYNTAFLTQWDLLDDAEKERFIELASIRIKSLASRPFVDLDDLEQEQGVGVKQATSRLIDYWMEYGLDLNRISGSMSLGSFSASQTVPSDPDYVPKNVFDVLQDVGLYAPIGFVTEDIYRQDDDRAITYGVRFKTLERIKNVALDKTTAEDSNKNLAIPTVGRVLEDIREAKLSPFVIIGSITEQTGTNVLPTPAELDVLFQSGKMIMDDGVTLVPVLTGAANELVPTAGEAIRVKLQNGTQEITNYDGGNWEIDNSKNSQQSDINANTLALEELNGNTQARAIKASEGDTRYIRTDGSNTMLSGYTPTNDQDVMTKKLHDADTSGLQGQITTNKTNISDNATLASDADKLSKTNAGLISTNTTNIATNVTNILFNKGEAEANTAEVSALNNRSTALENRVTAVETEATTNASDIISNTDKINVNIADIAGADVRLKAVEAKSTDNDSRLTTIEPTVLGNSNQIGVNQTKSEDNGKAIVALQTDVASNTIAAADYANSKSDFVKVEDIQGGIDVHFDVPFTQTGKQTIADLSSVDMSKFVKGSIIVGVATPIVAGSVANEYGRDAYDDGNSTDNILVGQNVQVTISATQLINEFATEAEAIDFARRYHLTKLSQLTGAAGANVDATARTAAAEAKTIATLAKTTADAADKLSKANKAQVDLNTAQLNNNQPIISANTTGVAANKISSATNLASIGTISTDVNTNRMNIETNSNDIADMGDKVVDNSNAIKANTTDITTLTPKVTANTAKGAANATAIAANLAKDVVQDGIIAGINTRVAANTFKSNANASDIGLKQSSAIPGSTTTSKTVEGAIKEINAAYKAADITITTAYKAADTATLNSAHSYTDTKIAAIPTKTITIQAVTETTSRIFTAHSGTSINVSLTGWRPVRIIAAAAGAFAGSYSENVVPFVTDSTHAGIYNWSGSHGTTGHLSGDYVYLTSTGSSSLMTKVGLSLTIEYERFTPAQTFKVLV